MAGQAWQDAATFRSPTQLTVDQLPHLHGDQGEFSRVVADTEAQLVREKSDWRWAHVGSVFPFSDVWIDKPVRRPRSAIHRHEYRIAASAEALHGAIVYALERHELMRSVAVVRTPTAGLLASTSAQRLVADEWYTVMRMSAPGLVERRIDVADVDSLDGMGDVSSDTVRDGLRVQKPGFLVHFTVVRVRGDDTQCGLMYQINHAIFDVTSLHLFLADLHAALSGHVSADPVPSYGPYAYWRFMLPWTETGQANLQFHVNRLTGVSHTASTALWPPQRAKGWLKGNDEGWYGEDRSERVPLGPTGKAQVGSYGDLYAVPVAGMRQLRLDHGISPAKAVKAAQILFNVHTTGAGEAVFIGAEGGRMASKSMRPPLDLRAVPGPVVELALTRFPVESRAEKTLDFLARVQQDQLTLSAHCHYHQGHLRRQLPQPDAAYLDEHGPRQLFNWSPKVPLTFAPLITLTKFEGRSDYGMSWVFHIPPTAARETLVVEASWDNCQFSPDEAQRHTRTLLAAAQWLVDPANWARPIGDCPFDTSETYVYP